MLTTSHFLICVLLITYIHTSTSGAVGQCRTECVEQNKYKIVRVHLKDNDVMVGICRNTTLLVGNLATVIPFICDRTIGTWKFDDNDEEGIRSFSVRCPPNQPVSADILNACPSF